MIITTTTTVESKQITQYLGIVRGCSLTVLNGGRKMIQAGWDNGVEEAISLLESQASELGADAVVGVTINAYKSGSSDYVYVSGTAVKLA